VGYDRIYFLKKAYGLYPGVTRPVSAYALADHYRLRRAARGPLRAALDAAVGLGFLAWIGWRARQVQRKFGLSDAWRRGAIRIARDRFADPNDIALFRIGEASELDGYIRRFEDAAINKILNPAGWTKTCALADKTRFYARCKAAGLPHPETVAEMVDGQIATMADPGGRELVAKPADGEGGEGVRMIGGFADRADLEARLPAILGAARGMIVVQPRIDTHPLLADLALNALPTVRIVTMLDEAGEPEVVSATARFASVPDALVDNMKAGGLLAPVDLETGVLGVACKGYGGGDHAVHPVTGAAIEGRILPDWHGATTLAMEAHRVAFPDYVVIGWDIALTPAGPILIEGNGKPGVLMPQRAARRGLAQGRYGALLSHNLAMKS
jgi:hypothetical protein